MPAPVVYRWDDPGAPVLSGTAGALVDVLDKCLVQGYGSKAPAGWEIVFTGTHKRVYRPAVGLRFFYLVDDSAARSSTAPRVATVQGFESISNIDTGTGPFPSTAAPWLKSVSADSTARPWVIIADAQGVYYSPRYDGLTSVCTYAGDGVPLANADAWFSMVTGAETDSGAVAPSSGRFYIGHGDTYPYSIAGITRKFDGTPGPAAMGGYRWRISTSPVPGNAGLPYPFRGKLLYEACAIRDPDGLRGWMPGLYSPDHTRPLPDLSTYVDGTRTLLALTLYSNGSGQLLIDTGAGFRP